MEIKKTIKSILSLDDDMLFIYQLYRFLLNREPDQLGLEHYSSLLAQGILKDRIILDIISSKEYRLLGRKINGIYILKYKNLLLRVISLGFFGKYISTKQRLYRIQKQNNLLLSLLNEVSRKLDIVETPLNENRKNDNSSLDLPHFKTYNNKDCLSIIDNVLANYKNRSSAHEK